MVVQHNMQAANTNRQLGITNTAQAKATEKLASGYRINRAADDAAGLSISEKMRSQVRGLDRASTNASDGISVVQTAEGALNEVHAMLQRMNELATQAANDTNTSVDRNALKLELNELASEIMGEDLEDWGYTLSEDGSTYEWHDMDPLPDPDNEQPSRSGDAR